MSDRDDLEAVVAEMRDMAGLLQGRHDVTTFLCRMADRLEASRGETGSPEPSRKAIQAAHETLTRQALFIKRDEMERALRAAYAIDHANDGKIEAIHQGQNG